MNQLCKKFGQDELAVLAFPCNQFGHQENSNGEEILNVLRHVRPGNGFQPQCIMFDKVAVNGSSEHPVFSWLKQHLPLPSDDAVSLMADPNFLIWKPVKRSDISWNFEKFLVSADGKPVRRYSKKFQTIDLQDEIQAQLKM